LSAAKSSPAKIVFIVIVVIEHSRAIPSAIASARCFRNPLARRMPKPFPVDVAGCGRPLAVAVTMPWRDHPSLQALPRETEYPCRGHLVPAWKPGCEDVCALDRAHRQQSSGSRSPMLDPAA